MSLNSEDSLISSDSERRSTAESIRSSDWESEEEEGLTEEEKAKRQKFARLRSQHYNMKAALQDARRHSVDEEDEEDGRGRRPVDDDDYDDYEEGEEGDDEAVPIPSTRSVNTSTKSPYLPDDLTAPYVPEDNDGKGGFRGWGRGNINIIRSSNIIRVSHRRLMGIRRNLHGHRRFLWRDH
ncbi:hypothetical protein BC829DRAFT_414416 [Chytridium lagenaria]|nr:hypothetical protein BC829DRAFT_414416 [Chytridium lagenaria]